MGFVWAKFAQLSGEWSDFDLIRGHFCLERSGQGEFRAYFERLERTLVSSEDALV